MAQAGSNDEKTRGRKSRWTVPFKKQKVGGGAQPKLTPQHCNGHGTKMYTIIWMFFFNTTKSGFKIIYNKVFISSFGHLVKYDPSICAQCTYCKTVLYCDQQKNCKNRNSKKGFDFAGPFFASYYEPYIQH